MVRAARRDPGRGPKRHVTWNGFRTVADVVSNHCPANRYEHDAEQGDADAQWNLGHLHKVSSHSQSKKESRGRSFSVVVFSPGIAAWVFQSKKSSVIPNICVDFG